MAAGQNGAGAGGERSRDDQAQLVPAGYTAPVERVVARSAAGPVIASFFVPGLGSMIAGQVGKGIAILVAHIVAIALCWVLIGFVLAPAVWIFGMVTAAGDVRRWNAAHGIIS